MVDDQYNDNERYVYVEPKPELVSEAWLASMVRTLRRWPGWGAGVGIAEGAYFLLFGEKMMVTGGLLRHCTTVREVVRVCQEEVPARQRAKEQRIQARLRQIEELLPGAFAAAQSNPEPAHLRRWYETRSDGSKGVSVWVIHKEPRSEFELDEYRYLPDAQRPSLHWLLPSGQRLDDALEKSALSQDRAGAYLLAEWELVRGLTPVSTAKTFTIRSGRSSRTTLRLDPAEKG